MRGSGILMHLTSLPGACGIGTMGREAYAFIDFLEKAGQCFWQILPLTPTGYGDSPYQSCSAFAGNHYLIDLEQLEREGLLERSEYCGICWGEDPARADFGRLYENRLKVLRIAFSRFTETGDFHRFCSENGAWLSDFSVYMALKDRFGGAPWYDWEDPLKHRDPDAMWQVRQQLKQQIKFYSFVQYLFYCQWNALRDYAHQKGIRIIGDVPIYVPMDSCDVWSNPELFQLDNMLRPTAVAGCPPDAFTRDGQLWGNPLYRWQRHEEDDYNWWIFRMAAAGRLYDVVRLDHFRGFEAYWSVPAGDTTARNGKWVKGPGRKLMDAIKKRLPGLEIIAEDLGYLTPEVLQLRDASGFPGMKVLEFAFDSREPSLYLPHNYIANTVCYTGTHDNMTLRQWLETAPDDTVAYAKEYMALNEQEGLVWGVIRTAMSSVSRLCIVQMQDVLELGGEARMNSPGTTGGNWVWRMPPGSLTPALADKLCRMTALYNRNSR